MSKRKFSTALVLGTSLGVIAITFLGVFLIHNSESFAATSSSSLSEPPISNPSSKGAQSPGSGSYCGTLSLAYICKLLAIEAPPSKVAGLLKDRGTGVSMLDLARGSLALGLKAKGIRTDLEGLKALTKPVIAYLPKAKHFLVVLKADDTGVTCIDLAGQNTLAWYSPAEFADKWNGEILTFDNSSPELCSALSKAEMDQYIGGCGSSCTNVLQNEGVSEECENISGCWATAYYTFLKRYGCESCEEESTCNESSMSRGYRYPCVTGDEPLKCEPYFGASPTLWGSIMACN